VKRQGKSRLKLDPSSFNLELFFVRTQKYIDTYCISLSNYITPNNQVTVLFTTRNSKEWIDRAIQISGSKQNDMLKLLTK
jgi:hypothetical protein